MSVLLGCLADDFTGATDLAGFLVASGMNTMVLIDLPKDDIGLNPIDHSPIDHSPIDLSPIDLSTTDAVVIALKSRTQEVNQAVADSLKALEWLQRQGCRQFYFKYCSTFDSTPRGNIGPVCDALLDALGETFTIACPALPVNGRTVCHGYLFVNGVLLNESGMAHHPLTPMYDANLPRVLAAQARGKVGLVDYLTVSQGSAEIQKKLALLAKEVRYAIVDTLSQTDLIAIGHACRHLTLITGGSGLAIGLADNFEQQGMFHKKEDSDRLEKVEGDAVVLSGSCSQATREQVAVFQARHPSLQIDPLSLSQGRQTLDRVMRWYEEHRGRGPILLYATDQPEAVQRGQEALGTAQAGHLIERLMAEAALRLRALGVNKWVVAGGETSGAVVKALGVSALKIGPTIAPGVPLAQAVAPHPQLLALKSGNFGDENFFEKAIEMMQ